MAAPHVSKIVASVTSALSSLYDPQRVVVAAFFAEVSRMVCYCAEISRMVCYCAEVSRMVCYLC